MIRHFRSCFIRTLLLTLSATLPTTSTAFAGDEVASLSRNERLQLWSSSIKLVEQIKPGVADESSLPVDETVQSDPRVATWLKDYRDELAKHEEWREHDFKTYVEQGKAHLEKHEIVEALIVANRALSNATDKDTFLASDWVKRLTDEAVAKANGFRSEGEWRKAYEIFYNVAALHENNKEYKKARKDCLTYARLDAVYTEDGKWAERLEDIVPRNATDALDRIDKYYVEKADFQKITASGFEHLLLLCDSKVMHKTFSGLADDELREEFRARLKARLSRIRRAKHFTVNDAKQHFRRGALKINAQTVNLPQSLIIYEFMSGALDPLDDFSSMIWPVEFREFDKHTRGDFVGVGISITGGGVRPISVQSPLEGTPAFRAGVRAGDKITHVNGVSLEGVSLTKAVQMITGPIDTEVTLTILRESEGRTMDLHLKRAKIEIASVKGVKRHPDDPERWDYILDRDFGIGYVRITSFQDNTARQLRSAIDEALDEGAKGLILDLRFNPGGLLKSAVEVTRLFQKRDEKVVSTRGLAERPWSPPSADQDGPFTSLPLIVLANQYSASASEIVSGALEDNNRAIVVGERTFGKFSVQKLMELGGSSAHLKLTTARYYLPLGRSLHHEEGATEWGVAPDVAIKLVPKEIARIRIMQQSNDVLLRAGEKDADELAKAEEDKAETSDTNAAESEDGETLAKTDDKAKQDADTDAENPDADAVELDADTVAEADGEDDEEEELHLADDPNEVPDVDLQLDTASLLMRLHLLGESTLQLAESKDAQRSRNRIQRP